MPNLAELTDIMQIAIFIGGGIFFLARLGGKIDRLSETIDRLDNHLRDHETRIRVLEKRPTHPTTTTQRSA
jgi:hypothetical protein